jgi:hypothetical protein
LLEAILKPEFRNFDFLLLNRLVAVPVFRLLMRVFPVLGGAPVKFLSIGLCFGLRLKFHTSNRLNQ